MDWYRKKLESGRTIKKQMQRSGRRAYTAVVFLKCVAYHNHVDSYGSPQRSTGLEVGELIRPSYFYQSKLL